MSQDLSLYHLTRPNKTEQQKPAALFLFHGYGSNEGDLFTLADQLPDELFIISVRAPRPLEPVGHAWYSIYFDTSSGKFNDTEEAIEARDLIAKFIAEATEAYNLDAKNITLLGFSQGCILSLATVLSYPGIAKNVIGLSGYIDPAMLASGYENNDYSALNVYVSHGSVDQVIPVEWAQETPKLLAKVGIETKLHEYPVGHDLCPQNFYDFRDWLVDKI